jgi:hypothetical protein
MSWGNFGRSRVRQKESGQAGDVRSAKPEVHIILLQQCHSGMGNKGYRSMITNTIAATKFPPAVQAKGASAFATLGAPGAVRT